MSKQIFESLAWLPPLDMSLELEFSKVALAETPMGSLLSRLARHKMPPVDLDRIGKRITALRRSGKSLDPLEPVNLAILGTGTLDLIVPTLVASGARHGLSLACQLGTYGQAVTDALSPQSPLLVGDAPDVVLLALDHRSLPLVWEIGAEAGERDAVKACADLLTAMVRNLRERSGATCMLQTIAVPPETYFGSLDRRVAGTPRHAIVALNDAIVQVAEQTKSLLLDVAALSELVGSADWFSRSEWNLAKLPFSSDFVPLFCDHVARLLSASRGRSRKCLVLDLDNTLWGGVIGDDGLEGINIAQGDAEGEAFLELQRYALNLRSRGIVLAVCSKNTDEVARKPFREHPEMILKEDHISIFQANWSDKATNLKAIAGALNFSLDALVFVDDNPMERDLVRRALPDVAVIELPEDPALYATTLAAGGFFEALSFSQEDMARAGLYSDNARRVSLMSGASNIEDYLRSLDMQITFGPFDEVGRDRIVQLIGKSNQFNLTTRRYTALEIERLADDPEVVTLQIRLADRCGDNGMISVVICRPGEAQGEWAIDTWLMSCRVLGRRVENAVLSEIARLACDAGISTLVGRYAPTAKNGLVRDHYEKLGFTLDGAFGSGETFWRIEVETVPAEDLFTIKRNADLMPLDTIARPHAHEQASALRP